MTAHSRMVSFHMLHHGAVAVCYSQEITGRCAELCDSISYLAGYRLGRSPLYCILVMLDGLHGPLTWLTVSCIISILAEVHVPHVPVYYISFRKDKLHYSHMASTGCSTGV